MTVKWTGYNNVGVAGTALMSVLSYTSTLTLPKAMLIMPLVMHDATVAHLGNGKVRHRDAAALVANRPELFANFSTRYEDSLGVSLNAIQLLVELGYVSFDGEIRIVKPLKVSNTFGKRAQKITRASSGIAKLLMSPVDELYLNFRVQL